MGISTNSTFASLQLSVIPPLAIGQIAQHLPPYGQAISHPLSVYSSSRGVRRAGAYGVRKDPWRPRSKFVFLTAPA